MRCLSCVFFAVLLAACSASDDPVGGADADPESPDGSVDDPDPDAAPVVGTDFPESKWFILMPVTEPSDFQIQLWVHFLVDGENERTTGLHQDADRFPDHQADQCGPACTGGDACRTQGVGSPTCVDIEQYAGGPMEFVDWLPSPENPDGFHFMVQARVRGTGGNYTFDSLPFDFTAPYGFIDISIEQGEFHGTITESSDTGRMVMDGIFTAETVWTGPIPGNGAGTVEGVSVTDAEWPADALLNTTAPSELTWP